MSLRGVPTHPDYLGKLPNSTYYHLIFYAEVNRPTGTDFVKDYAVVLGEINGKYTLPRIFSDVPMLTYVHQTLGLFGSPESPKWGVYDNRFQYLLIELPYKIYGPNHVYNRDYKNRMNNVAFMQAMVGTAASVDSAYGKYLPAAAAACSPDVFRAFDNIAYVYMHDLINLSIPPPTQPVMITNHDRFLAEFFCVDKIKSDRVTSPFTVYSRFEHGDKPIPIDTSIVNVIRDAQSTYFMPFLRPKVVVVSTKKVW
ncbi:hypothetical protein BNJ_00216 [Kaumoebavirus]|uniref:hypothetical protein n=1 Tax=Kaumoebavirus TaxID=1859492 RepID=UPI0009C3A276|nr:hypothetical protein BNJ_00216 [Kaumoebavirus]ARA72045.1 hypothetical protein BNJ_00216 [Kaumoebavirus]